MTTYAKKMTKLRKGKNLTVKDLSKKTKIHPQAIYNIEAGRQYYSLNKIKDVANALDVCPKKIFNLMCKEKNEKLFRKAGLT